MEIDYPEKAFQGQVVNFRFRVGSGINQVKLIADQKVLASLEPRQNFTSYTYIFRQTGLKQLKFLGVSATDTLNLQIGQVTIFPRVDELQTDVDEKLIEAKPISKAEKYAFPPLPFEDKLKGRNENAHSLAFGHPSEEEKLIFIESIQNIVTKMARIYKIPASVVMSMEILESGYGYGRLSSATNNLFGLKKWKNLSKDAFQLKGQPLETSASTQIITERLKTGAIIFDEVQRTDNWYWTFDSRKNCVEFFVEHLLFNKGSWQKSYLQVVENYKKNLAKGMNKHDAADQFAFDLGENGYCTLGGKVYQQRISRVMNDWSLYDLD